MTVNQMRARLDEISKLGHGDREVVIRTHRKRSQSYFRTKWASSALVFVPSGTERVKTGVVEVTAEFEGRLSTRGWTNVE